MGAVAALLGAQRIKPTDQRNGLRIGEGGRGEGVYGHWYWYRLHTQKDVAADVIQTCD